MAKYAITPEGQLTAEGKVIGCVRDGALELTEEATRHGTALMYLKGLAFDWMHSNARPQTNQSAQAESAGTAEGSQASLLEMPESLGELRPLDLDEPQFGLPPEHQPHAREIPPAPAQDPRFGDKTPAYAEWLFKYFPEKAKTLYAGRKIVGVQMPPGGETKMPAPIKVAPIGSDLPEDAMAQETKEVWLRKAPGSQ